MNADDLIETFPRPSLTPETDYVQTIHQPAREADTVPADAVLRSSLAGAYPHALYSHQATALRALAAGDNVTVSTATASGKTHVYGLQIARSLLDAGVLAPDGSRRQEHNDTATALCLYPTKALTKDQKTALETLYDQLGLDIRVAIYDGDVESGRREIRETADVILTNPAAVNVYLEHHDKWSRFYSALEVIAIDESHTYTGIQGMHVAWILRRLQRVLAYWGSTPQYTVTSATIGNPKAHSETLLDAPVTVVDEDGSPHGLREIVLWNPPPRNQAGDTDTDGVVDRVPASVEAPKVFNHLTTNDVQTLLFCPSRKLTELAIQRADAHRSETPAAYGGRPVTARAAYNAGLGRRTRHTREAEFKAGALTGLATTSALELGIDIGDLDATVLLGYPGQRQAFWQRVGRAGRGTDRSLAVLVGDHRTLDQYVLTNPEYLLETDVEDAVIDTANNTVFATHVLAAADEIALDTDDAGAFADADRLQTAVQMWRQAGYLEGTLETGVHYTGPPRPQTRVNMYGTSETDYRVTLAADVDHDQWDIPATLDIEPVDQNRAARDYHEGAVRLHDGQQYEVVAVDETRPQPTIELAPVDCAYYTRTRSKVTVMEATSERSREVNGFTLHYGTGTVLVHHHAYDQLYVGSSDPKQQGLPTKQPPLRMETQLCWVEVPTAVERALLRRYQDYGVETGVGPEDAGPAHLGYVAGLHAAEHATIQTAPLELRVDKQDLGGLATLVLDTHYAAPETDPVPDSIGDSFEAAARTLEHRGQQLSGPTASGWFIYDGIDGGVGFTRAIYENFEALARRAREQLASCDCGRPNGCPACTFDENCGNDNQPLLRASAVDVLDQLLGWADRDALIQQQPPTEADRRPVVYYS